MVHASEVDSHLTPTGVEWFEVSTLAPDSVLVIVQAENKYLAGGEELGRFHSAVGQEAFRLGVALDTTQPGKRQILGTEFFLRLHPV